MIATFAARWRAFTGLPSGLKALIILSFVVALGSYMITPFLGVLMVKGIGLNVRIAGIMVAAATFIQFGGSTLGSAVVGKIGLKPTMVFALGLRTLGLLLLGAATRSPWLAYPGVVLVAAGPALYLPANKAYIVTCVSADLRPLFLGISSAALNAGMGLGPLLAALLIDVNPLALLVSAAVLFTLIAVTHQVTLRPLAQGPQHVSGGLRESGRGSNLDALRGALRPVLFTALAYYLYFFFQSFVGLYASARSDTTALGWAMLTNCVIVVILQPRLSKWIARAGYRRLLIMSFLLMAGGMALISAAGIAMLLAGTALISFGEVFLFLRCDLELVDRVPDNPTFAFGVQRLTAGIGGLLAGVAGGFLFARFQGAGHLGMFWIAVAVQCVIATFIALAFATPRVRSPDAPEPEPVLEPIS